MVRNESGQSLVEMALVLPILLLLLVGIIDFGRVLYSYSHLHLATQEAVRLGGLGKNDSEITSFAKDYIQIGDSTKLQVVITPKDSSRTSGQYVTVKLEYPLELITPIISGLLPNPIQLKADSTIRVE
ncbi:TadE/TadG family type IV pilus assembly protein [Bacillus sp. DJP31]|uniref:TadE/TadG family type IV pilus assembly protein n=1 Tax=Bacillus sp. DJP31 TaxID=3409789 RepID=UPI003BB7F2AD